MRQPCLIWSPEHLAAEAEAGHRELGAAIVLLKEAAAAAARHYGLAGRVYLSNSGYLLLSVPNAIVRGAFDALHEPGVELPLRDGKLEAHITLMHPDEVERIGGADKVSERGHTLRWTLGPLKSTATTTWPGMSRVYYLTVESPEIRALRKSYGLEPYRNGFDHHITVAVRRAGVLQENEVSKGGEPEKEAAAEKPQLVGYGSNCPSCGEPCKGRCRCFCADSWCKNGHHWHWCRVHDVMVVGPSDHSKSGCSCGVAKEAALRDPVSYVPRSALESVRQKGLLSSKALADDPEALAAAAAGRGELAAEWLADIRRRLALPRNHSLLGPNMMFAPPPAKTELAANHPLRRLDLVPVRVRLRELLARVPGVRVHGQELVPFDAVEADRLGDTYAAERHRDLAPAEVERYQGLRPSRLWRHYGEDDGAGRYAPNVPHAAVITPDHRIAPEFLELPKAADSSRRSDNPDDGPEEPEAPDAGEAAGYRFSGKVQGVHLRATLHRILDRLKLPGLAYNDARTGGVHATIGGSPELRAKALAALTAYMNGANPRGQVNPFALEPEASPRRLRHVALDDKALERMFHRQGFTSYFGWEHDPAAYRRHWVMRRYRLAEEGGKLVGDVPEPAYRQLRGLDPVYGSQVRHPEQFAPQFWLRHQTLPPAPDPAAPLSVPQPDLATALPATLPLIKAAMNDWYANGGHDYGCPEHGGFDGDRGRAEPYRCPICGADGRSRQQRRADEAKHAALISLHDLHVAGLRRAEADTNREPTPAQRDAGNYAKGRWSLHGLGIAIENPKGSVRRGVDKNGKPWETKLRDAYGYVHLLDGKPAGVSEADGDHTDIFVADDGDLGSKRVFIVNQVKPGNGHFDEHKVVVGARDEDHAREVYLRNYEKGWKGLGSIVSMRLPQLKKWLREGDRSRPAEQPPHQAVAMDLDGTLFEDKGWRGEDHFGPLREGAKELLDRLAAEGVKIYIHTVRGNTAKIKAELDRHKLTYHGINENPDQPEGSSNKLIAHAYVDDRGVDASRHLLDEVLPDVLDKLDKRASVRVSSPAVRRQRAAQFILG